MTDTQLLQLLRCSIAEAASMAAWAHEHNIERVYVWRVANGERPMSATVAAALGYERVTGWRKIDG